MTAYRKKRILFVRPSMGEGGADRVTLQLLQAFDREKYEAELALMRAEGPFMEDIPADVCVHICNVTSLWWMTTPLKKIMTTGQYDYVYSTCGGTAIPTLLAYKLLKSPNFKVIVSERNILFPAYKGWLKRRFMLGLKKWLYQSADWVTAVSYGVKREIIEMLAVDEPKALVVNNPVVDETLLRLKDEPLNHPIFDGKTPTVLAVGRFVEQKDYPTLLRAFQIVIGEQAANLAILGKGPLLASMKKMAKSLGIEKNVHFLGFDKNPFKYMANCDVFVVSSLHEGMPGVLVQAMACGAACVSTDCPTGPNEVIEHGNNGLLVKIGDVGQLAQSIVELLNNPALKDKFRLNAPNAVRRFESEVAVDSYFSFLN